MGWGIFMGLAEADSRVAGWEKIKTDGEDGGEVKSVETHYRTEYQAGNN